MRRDVQMQQRRRQSIRDQPELFDAPDDPSFGGPIMAAASAQRTLGQGVFLVHGHDEETKLEVATFIQRISGRRPGIRHEQANAGRTIIEKFEDHAAEAGFAVVLLTADDEGGPVGGQQQPRARQNVVLELGFFMGALSRGRVVALLDRRRRDLLDRAARHARPGHLHC